VEKLIVTLSNLSFLPLTFGRKGKSSLMNPTRRIKLSPKFWRIVLCPQGCGACCPAFTLDWIQPEFLQLPRSIKSMTKEREVVVNHVPFKIFTISNRPGSPCRFLNTEKRCEIYPFRPLSCRLEPLKFIRIHGTTYIFKSPFRRLKNTKCIFLEAYSRLERLKDLENLKSLKGWADYFKIKTALPEIISRLSSARVFEELSIYGPLE